MESDAFFCRLYLFFGVFVLFVRFLFSIVEVVSEYLVIFHESLSGAVIKVLYIRKFASVNL